MPFRMPYLASLTWHAKGSKNNVYRRCSRVFLIEFAQVFEDRTLECIMAGISKKTYQFV